MTDSWYLSLSCFQSFLVYKQLIPTVQLLLSYHSSLTSTFLLFFIFLDILLSNLYDNEYLPIYLPACLPACRFYLKDLSHVYNSRSRNDFPGKAWLPSSSVAVISLVPSVYQTSTLRPTLL